MGEKKENQFIKEEEEKMQSKKIKSISIWGNEAPTPRVKVSGEEINGIRIDGIQNNIYCFDNNFITPTTYDSLVLILNINKLNMCTRKEVLKSNFGVYKVGLEYADGTYEEYQSTTEYCTCCEKYYTVVREELDINELMIFVKTKKMGEA